MTTHVETGKHIVSESLVSEMRRVDEAGNKNSSALCIVEGPCMEFGRVNQNNRIYSRKLIEDRIINYKPVQEAIKNKCMLGEGGHPETRIDISYPEVGLCVEKIWIPENSDHLVYGRFAILDTPVGRILDSLIRYGSKIGISARALAESKMEGNTEIMSETEYDLITFDAVPDPGFKCAHLEKVQESKSLASMTTSELKNNVAALNALKIPAFESRMHEMVEELTKRTDDDALSAVLRSKGMNKQTTGRKLESKRISVEEVMQSTTKSGKHAPGTKVQEELNSENVAYAKALADLDYYKSECERLHSELEIAVSAKDAVKVQNESLKHGIAKGIYQARYLENFSRLACEADELSKRVDRMVSRMNRLTKTMEENNYHVTSRPLRNESVQSGHIPNGRKAVLEGRTRKSRVMDVDELLSKTTLRREPRRYKVESLLKSSNVSNTEESNSVNVSDSRKHVNIKECIARWKQKAESQGIRSERMDKLMGNSRSHQKINGDERVIERRIRSISNFERDVHDLAPKRGVFLTGERK